MNDGSALTNNRHNVYGSKNNGSKQTMDLISMNDGSVLTNWHNAFGKWFNTTKWTYSDTVYVYELCLHSYIYAGKQFLVQNLTLLRVNL